MTRYNGVEACRVGEPAAAIMACNFRYMTQHPRVQVTVVEITVDREIG